MRQIAYRRRRHVALPPTDFLFVTDRPPLDVSPTGFTARYSAFIDAMARVGTTAVVVAPRRGILDDAGLDTKDVARLLSERFGSELAELVVLEPTGRMSPPAKISHHVGSWYDRRSPFATIGALSGIRDHSGCVLVAHTSLAHLGYDRPAGRTVFLLEEGFERQSPRGRGASLEIRLREAYSSAVAKRIYRAVGKSRGLVVAISEDEAHYFSAWIPRERLVVVPDGVDLHRFSELPFLPRSNGERFKIGVVGRLSESRNVVPTVDLVRSWQATPELPSVVGTEWRLIGASPAPDIRGLAGPNVIVTGYVSDLASEYASLDAAVIPAGDAQGAKSTLLAAWASGVAPVVSAASAAVMPVANGRNALVFRTTREAIDALTALRTDANLRGRIAEAGRETVQRFDADLLARQLISRIAAWPW